MSEEWHDRAYNPDLRFTEIERRLGGVEAATHVLEATVSANKAVLASLATKADLATMEAKIATVFADCLREHNHQRTSATTIFWATITGLVAIFGAVVGYIR